MSYIPAPGWGIARFIEPGMTSGGLHVPNVDGLETVVLVAKSAGHFKNGVLVPCDAPIGGKLIMLPEYLTCTNARLPHDQKFIQLHDILGWLPLTDEVDEVARIHAGAH